MKKILFSLGLFTFVLLSFCSAENSSCDTGFILSGYILESSINQSYCENNNLCNYSGYENSLSSCSNGLNSCQSSLSSCLAGNFTGTSWSSLFINNIQHLGASSIFIDIPEEISWDYAYSSGDDNMYIDVEGYNVDYDKINQIVNNQKYKPSSEDLTKIITDVIPLFVPGLVIILFIYFVFRFIKKIF